MRRRTASFTLRAAYPRTDNPSTHRALCLELPVEECDRAPHRQWPVRPERVMLALVNVEPCVLARTFQRRQRLPGPPDRAGLVVGAVMDQDRLSDPVEEGAWRHVTPEPWVALG